jgi:hypothetical protein
MYRHLLIGLSATILLSACASWDEHVAAPAHDPNHKQFMTGSRLAHKGRGGPDAVKKVSAQDARDQMRVNIENQPQSR